MKKCRNWFLIGVLAAIMASFFIPINRQHEIIVVSEVTANYPFAEDIVYRGERIGASSELCVELWLGEPRDVIPVIREDYLFFTRRVPA